MVRKKVIKEEKKSQIIKQGITIFIFFVIPIVLTLFFIPFNISSTPIIENGNLLGNLSSIRTDSTIEFNITLDQFIKQETKIYFLKIIKGIDIPISELYISNGGSQSSDINNESF